MEFWHPDQDKSEEQSQIEDYIGKLMYTVHDRDKVSKAISEYGKMCFTAGAEYMQYFKDKKIPKPKITKKVMIVGVDNHRLQYWINHRVAESKKPGSGLYVENKQLRLVIDDTEYLLFTRDMCLRHAFIGNRFTDVIFIDADLELPYCVYQDIQNRVRPEHD